MTSIYQRALGADFQRLHPQIQQRFGFSSADGVASIGTGMMEHVWKGRLYTEPFLRIGSWRSIMFPETGRNIPFRIENYAFVDRFGREDDQARSVYVHNIDLDEVQGFDAVLDLLGARPLFPGTSSVSRETAQQNPCPD